MTSHIFIAMGMWDDVIDANTRAVGVVNEQRAARSRSAAHCGHYPTWLQYGLLQKGRTGEARRMLDECRADVMNAEFKSGGGFDTAEGRANEFAHMVAADVASGGVLRSADRVTLPDSFLDARFTLTYAEAIDAYRAKNADALKSATARLRSLQKAIASKPIDHSSMPGMAMGMNMSTNDTRRMDIIIQQIDALSLSLAGKTDESIAMLKKAAEAEASMPYEFGPPFVDKPSYELLAEQLAAAKNNGEAADAYRHALARTPGRTMAVEGLKKAAK
jgi:predicted Zn-dependent protease